MNRLITIAGAFAVGLALSGCGGASERTDADGPRTYPPAPEGVLRINIGSDPPELDPSLTQDIPSFWLINHLFEPLARLEPDGSIAPAQAHSWEHEDYTTWTFHLRDDNYWHNGDPVTAHDFVYATRRILNPETAARYAMMVYSFIDGGPEYYDREIGEEGLGIRAIDDHTLEIRLQFPAPYFLGMLNHSVWYPLHQPTIEQHGRRWTEAGNLIGNGPFRLTTFRSRDRAICDKWEDYWAADEVYFDQLVFRTIEEESVEMAAFLAGDIDMTNQVLNREAPRWMSQPEFVARTQIGTYYVPFNMTQPPFDDIALRRAFSLTINRQSIVERTTRRGEPPATGFVPVGITMPNGQDYREIAPQLIDPANFAADVEQAREVLREAGYAVAGGSGNPLPRLEFLYNTTDLNRDIAERLQNEWAQLLGASIRLQNMEWAVLIDRANNKDFQFMRAAWIGDYLDPLTFFEIWETGHGKNNAGYSNPRYDELLSIARTETDLDKRMEAFIEMERLLVVEDVVLAPIYFYSTPLLIRPDVEGVKLNVLSNLDASRARRVSN